MGRAIIHDCDPGNDDAVAILMALSSPEKIQVRGFTAVAGNAPLKWMHQNIRKICELAGRSDMKVFAGCSRPKVRALKTASFMHGHTGMDGCTLPDPTMPLQSQHAVDFMIEEILNSKEKITLVATGALTNVAMAMVKEPKILDRIEEVVWMGGTTEAGNITIAAEYNAFVDPHAAHVVFESGVKVTMFGLNVTHKVLITPERVKKFRALGTSVGTEIANMLETSMKADQERYDLAGRAIHDACTMAYLIDPSLFTLKHCAVQVEISSDAFMGATAVSHYSAHKDKFNAHVAFDVDEERVFSLIYNCLAWYGSPEQAAK